MGSEMCIRDRSLREYNWTVKKRLDSYRGRLSPAQIAEGMNAACSCLLYTSDAADERSSVDLGGRRIIKKKKNRRHAEHSYIVIKTRVTN